MRPLILGVALIFSVLLAGCQTPHAFATPDASWKTRIGQLKHTNAQRTLIVDVVVQQRGAREFQLDALKAGSFPIISVRQDATLSRAEGLLAHGKWQGAPGQAPSDLRPWLALRDAFANPQSSSAGAITAWTGQATPQRLSLNFPQAAQRFVFQFQR